MDLWAERARYLNDSLQIWWEGHRRRGGPRQEGRLRLAACGVNPNKSGDVKDALLHPLAQTSPRTRAMLREMPTIS
eukprot:11199236-Lingulodinium_polyedra.AAC.1